MQPYLTATMAAARNHELERRAARGLPLWALDAARATRPQTAVVRAIRRYLGHASKADEQPLRRAGRGARGARARAT